MNRCPLEQMALDHQRDVRIMKLCSIMWTRESFNLHAMHICWAGAGMDYDEYLKTFYCVSAISDGQGPPA